MSEVPNTGYAGWALVEQMGFRKTVGKVSEVEMYGTKMLRLDIPPPDGSEDGWTTRFCGGPSLYQVSPLSEELALAQVKRQGDARPVRPTDYRLPAPETDRHDQHDANAVGEKFNDDDFS